MFPYRCESLLEKEFAEILFVSKEHFVWVIPQKKSEVATEKRD